MKARFLICLILLLGIETMVVRAEEYPMADSLEMPLRVAWDIKQPVGKWNEDFKGYHLGEDIITTQEEPVYAIGNGIVRFSGSLSGYGYMVLVEHNLREEGKIIAVYAHMGKKDLVGTGQKVSKGQRIGFLSANPQENGGYPFIHLHFGIRPGEYTTKTVYIHYYNGDTGKWGWKWSWLYMGYSRSGNFSETQKEPYDFDDNYILNQWQKDLKGFIEKFNQQDASFQKFRDLVELYLSSPYPNTRYYGGKARDLVGNPIYEKREDGQKHQDYWSFLVPTDKGWSLCITYKPGSTPEQDSYLAPYPVAIHPELVSFYKANRNTLGSALCDTIMGRFDGIVELPCYKAKIKKQGNRIWIENYVRGFAPGTFNFCPDLGLESFWIARAYNYHFGELGCGYAENPAYYWNDVGVRKTIQDFNGGGANDSAIITNPAYNTAYLIGNAFWQYYKDNPEARKMLVVPSSPEITEKKSIIQKGS
ncbi:MAG: M23 family metallopeptidase [Nanoarchaeota archaeon]|nr:M23 family metallopeptidase [Patescibacteria group bacterium]MBU1988113.1 M23 family metallopeptidase [Nanoarchaeota archaeon]